MKRQIKADHFKNINIKISNKDLVCKKRHTNANQEPFLTVLLEHFPQMQLKHCASFMLGGTHILRTENILDWFCM